MLLVKDVPFDFSIECMHVFNTLKKELVNAPIMVTLDWEFPFELMRDASDIA